jgi:hypothetical protein
MVHDRWHDTRLCLDTRCDPCAHLFRNKKGCPLVLTIRPDQMSVLAISAREEFERRAVRHLRACLPRPPADAVLHDRTRTAITSAASYGITDELSVLRYLNAMFLLGPRFDTDPRLAWVGAILRDDDFTGPTKMAILKDLIARHLKA